MRRRFTTKDCKEEGSCGKLNVNTLLWSPHGRLLLLGVGVLLRLDWQGFGNLNGDIFIWDDVDRKRIVQFHTDYITSCAWAPNSRYLILGTCYPRMKVDNRLYVYKFNGKKVYQEDFDLLYEVSVRPVLPGILPIRPPTVDDMNEMRATVAKKAPSKYVPPHLRAKQGSAKPNSPAAMNAAGAGAGATSAAKKKNDLKWDWMELLILERRVRCLEFNLQACRDSRRAPRRWDRREWDKGQR